MRAHKFLKGETELSLAWVGDSPQAAATAGGARTLPAELSRRDGTGSPLESKIDVIGTLPRLGGAESADHSQTAVDDSADASDGAEATADSATGTDTKTAKSGKKRSSGKAARGQQGLATNLDELNLDLDEAKDEIARSKFDTESAVIVSHDDDDDGDDDSALF